MLGRERVEVLYAVRPELWGSGYATEIATLAIARAGGLGLDEVVGFTAADNRASRHVLEKAGLRFERTFERAGLQHWLGRVTTTATRRPPTRRGPAPGLRR